VRVGKCPGNQVPPFFEVTGLVPGQEYQFRVVAVNEEGDSDPLVTDKPITAKNPFDEPGKPGTPEITDYDNVSVDLKWAAPKSDGGAPIEKYIIQKKDKYKPEWENAAEVPGDQTTGKVQDLKERGEYQFRVIAVNKAGQSPPSDATNPHIAKHRQCNKFYNNMKLVFSSCVFNMNNLGYSETSHRSHQLEANNNQSWKANSIRRQCSR